MVAFQSGLLEGLPILQTGSNQRLWGISMSTIVAAHPEVTLSLYSVAQGLFSPKYTVHPEARNARSETSEKVARIWAFFFFFFPATS